MIVNKVGTRDNQKLESVKEWIRSSNSSIIRPSNNIILASPRLRELTNHSVCWHCWSAFVHWRL